MPEITLSQGTIQYEDEGQGSPVVFVHGFLVDADLWKGTALALHDRARCIRPTLPLGAHRTPMDPGADLSPRAVARILLDLLDALGLDDVTLVANDTGGAIVQLALDEDPGRVARVVFTSCDCFDKFPPPPYNALRWLPHIPGAMRATALSAHVGAVRRAAFWPLVRKRLSAELLEQWWAPLRDDARIRDDARKLLRAASPAELLDVSTRLSRFEGRVLVAWGADDRIFKPELGRRLAALFADSDFVEVPGSGTFVPCDQPALLADLIAGELPLARPGADRPASSPAAG